MGDEDSKGRREGGRWGRNLDTCQRLHDPIPGDTWLLNKDVGHRCEAQVLTLSPICSPRRLVKWYN